jgi:hypothetical protein
MKHEIWKAILGYEGYYEVSNFGRVKSLARFVKGRWKDKGEYHPVAERILIQGIERVVKGGYHRVVLQKCGKVRYANVHILVLETFVGPRPKDLVGAHNNGNVDDNRLNNLSYKTQQENCLDRYRHGRGVIGEAVNTARLKGSEVLEIRRLFKEGKMTINELAEKYNVHYDTIRYAVARKSWKHLK